LVILNSRQSEAVRDGLSDANGCPGSNGSFKESDDIIKLYGLTALVPGTFAANCLLARKLSENGVRFVQLYHQGWDQHGNLPFEIAKQAKDVDQASAALVT
jgi:hypothetical protein